MAFVSTGGMWLPGEWQRIIGNPQFNSSVIDAAGEKVAYVGRVWNRDGTTKSISRVGFRFGTVVKSGGSGLIVSLQNVDMTNGPPGRPDTTQDQTVAIPNANIPASGSWYRTDPFSANRSVAFGELLAVVVEFDGSGWLTPDAINIAQIGSNNTVLQSIDSAGCMLFSGGTWAGGTGASLPNLVLEFTDGTFGRLGRAWPTSLIQSPLFNLNSTSALTGDEIAMAFQVPFECKVDGLMFGLSTNGSNAADFEQILYEGTTALPDCTVAQDANALRSNSSFNPCVADIPPTTLSPGVTYYNSIRPTTGNSIQTYACDVSDANHFQAWPGPAGWHYAQRQDLGAWSPNLTRRPWDAGIRISHVHESAVASGGGGGGFGMGGSF